MCARARQVRAWSLAPTARRPRPAGAIAADTAAHGRLQRGSVGAAPLPCETEQPQGRRGTGFGVTETSRSVPTALTALLCAFIKTDRTLES